jgi:hypothetical protein
MLRYVTWTLVAGFLCLLPIAVSAKGDDRCTIATKGDNPVVKSCQGGGRKAAKQTMKDLTKAAKQKKMAKVDCDDCHKDPDSDDFTLKPDAPDRFNQMLKLVGTTAP